ncbi:hypothetical protein Taro_005504 [Colocasia esculenta]|uniref:Phosphoglycerate mutase family protein n=1 Tax=Colocasia esculenta TaxID=4460 RepID=A0A843TT76_COLES|nr:hypothetical protein [Colocasia esculenta]
MFPLMVAYSVSSPPSHLVVGTMALVGGDVYHQTLLLLLWELKEVSIEFGLCEIISKQTIRIRPKDGTPWFPNVSALEALLPTAMIDHSVDCIYQELPPWEETLNGARERYRYVILALADKYPNENLLLVTHGEGVGVSVTAFMEETEIDDVEFCAYSQLQRKICLKDSRVPTAEPFTVLTDIGGSTGIRFSKILT